MKGQTIMRRAGRASALLAVGTAFQLGGCNFGEITVTQTVNGADLVASLVRGAILDPIDAYVTDAINQVFGVEG